MIKLKYSYLYLLAFFFLTCSNAECQTATKSKMRTVIDMAGRKVNVPNVIRSVYTDRFVSLIVFALDQKILCNATFTVSHEGEKYISPDYHTKKPLTNDSEEEILKLHPDVIIYGNLGGKETSDDADRIQKKLKIPVLVIDFRVSGYKPMYSFLGSALKREENVKPILAYIDKYVTPITQKLNTLPAGKKPKVYYAEGITGLETEPAGSFHSQVIDFLKAENVAKTSMGDVHGMSKVSMEQVLVWNPEIILVWTGFPAGMGMGNEGESKKSTYGHINTDASWATIKAVKDHKIYQIPSLPFGWFDRPPSSNCLPGVLWAAKILYPGLFDFNLDTAIKEYFSIFYHVSITDKDAGYLLHK
jgi:iron complex transport system substrate-binding protein